MTSNRAKIKVNWGLIKIQTKVLVTYASKYGSTQEVAEAIAATLRKNGLVVDLEPMREVKALEEYTAVVLGAPIYTLHWTRMRTVFFRGIAKLSQSFR